LIKIKRRSRKERNAGIGTLQGKTTPDLPTKIPNKKMKKIFFVLFDVRLLFQLRVDAAAVVPNNCGFLF